MARNFLPGVVLLAAILLMGISVPAAAQTGSSPAGNATATPTEAVERIDNHTVLLDSGFDSDAQTAWVEIRSDKPQAITIADGSYILRDEDMRTETVVAEPGEITRISMRAYKVGGAVALSISTDEVTTGELIKAENSLFSTQPDWTAAQVAGAFGFLGGFIAFTAHGYAKVHFGTKEAERIA